MTYKWHRWVREPDIPAFEALGWIATQALSGTHHGHWSQHMIYPDNNCDEPPEPRELA